MKDNCIGDASFLVPYLYLLLDLRGQLGPLGVGMYRLERYSIVVFWLGSYFVLEAWICLRLFLRTYLWWCLG
jgi:hypothetical protein